MTSTETFTLKKTYFKLENPKLAASVGSLRIRLKHRHLQPQNDAGTPPTTTSPVETRCGMKPHVLAYPELRQLCILKALESVNIDESLGECLRSDIDKFVVEKTKAFGVIGFAVVAEIELTKTEGPASGTEPPSLVRQRRCGLDVKDDVCDRRSTCSLVAALNKKKCM